MRPGLPRLLVPLAAALALLACAARPAAAFHAGDFIATSRRAQYLQVCVWGGGGGAARARSQSLVCSALVPRVRLERYLRCCRRLKYQ